MNEEKRTSREINIYHHNPECPVVKHVIAHAELKADEKGDTLSIIDDPKFTDHFVLEALEDNEAVDYVTFRYYKDLSPEDQEMFIATEEDHEV